MCRRQVYLCKEREQQGRHWNTASASNTVTTSDLNKTVLLVLSSNVEHVSACSICALVVKDYSKSVCCGLAVNNIHR